MAGVKLVHVPYKGSSQAMTDLLARQTSMMFGAGAEPRSRKLNRAI